MLGLAEDTLIAHEPFNIQPWAYALDGLAKFWFTYAPDLASAAISPAVSPSILLRFPPPVREAVPPVLQVCERALS